MKKIIAILCVVLLFLVAFPTLAAETVDWNAIIESSAATVVVPADPAQTVQSVQPESSGGINWTDIITKVVVWIIGGIGAALSALLVNVTKKYIAPWLRDVIIPWLKSNGLLSAAQAAVKYAEAELGRYTGDDKWNLALKTLKEQGYNIDSTAVVAALKSAWTDLNIAQIAAGIKEADDQHLMYAGIDIKDMTDDQIRSICLKVIPHGEIWEKAFAEAMKLRAKGARYW